MAEAAQGRRRLRRAEDAARRSSRSAPASPRTSRRPSSKGLRSMSGEFVRTPKQGEHARAAPLPRARRPSARSRSRSACSRSRSVVASLETGHWFATPFAMLFTLRLRLRRHARRHRAARAAPRRASRSRRDRRRRARARLESVPPRRRPSLRRARRLKRTRTPERWKSAANRGCGTALSAGRRSISRLLSDTCERWRGPRGVSRLLHARDAATFRG